MTLIYYFIIPSSVFSISWSLDKTTVHCSQLMLVATSILFKHRHLPSLCIMHAPRLAYSPSSCHQCQPLPPRQAVSLYPLYVLLIRVPRHYSSILLQHQLPSFHLPAAACVGTMSHISIGGSLPKLYLRHFLSYICTIFAFICQEWLSGFCSSVADTL